ncbi:glycosyltransferase [Leptolyngbya cf. ectocarpi LEGE 11479]|uniref:Glycosyltransferase n=1 Tax=Leptolyngbya cf. ectocarpi LEGE 11479 TaxID=1828722 RepID=A0A928ZVW3_LEPEC|nr:glycosyltransferase [Leptolyngbya ectocarpi]MBE9068388.1 glycosyltransferase [Leptolyngbya cf. ectocarpi LEGE 11479]
MTQSKVCITTLEFPPDVGGVGESVARIAKLLQSIGYEVHVAVFHSKQRKAEGYHRSDCSATNQDGIQVHRLTPASRSNTPILQDYRSEIYFQLKQLHYQYWFDLFHGFFINETGFITTLLAKEEQIPIINSVRGSDLHKHVFSPKQHGQISWILESSDWVTFVSRDLQKRGQVLVPAIKNRSSAFWNSIQPVEFSGHSTPPLASQLKGLVIGSVGRFRDKKGLEYLLDACADLKQTLPITLLLVGDFAERERPYWEAAIRDSGMADNTVLTGMVPRTEGMAYLRYMDVYAIPSLHDGCPNALLEAMLAGRAIIGTNVDAIGEILEHSYNGLVVSPGSSSELKTAILELAQSPELRQRLGKNAQTTVRQELSPIVEQRNWAKVYQQVLDCPLTVLVS